MKAEKEAIEAKYKVAYVDGKEEQVGNFRVEPPGLFRGRGEHPKVWRGLCKHWNCRMHVGAGWLCAVW